MAEFVRAQIFGTTFEITSRYEATIGSGSGILRLTVDQVHRSATRGHGSIWSGLVMKGTFVCPEQEIDSFLQLSERSAYPTSRRCKEDHETLLYSGAIEANLPRAETS